MHGYYEPQGVGEVAKAQRTPQGASQTPILVCKIYLLICCVYVLWSAKLRILHIIHQLFMGRPIASKIAINYVLKFGRDMIPILAVNIFYIGFEHAKGVIQMASTFINHRKQAPVHITNDNKRMRDQRPRVGLMVKDPSIFKWLKIRVSPSQGGVGTWTATKH